MPAGFFNCTESGFSTQCIFNAYCCVSWLTYTLVRFVKGSRPGRLTGFDFDEEDLLELDQYHDIIVASAIFGMIYD